jgi:hypothetical protein
MWPLVTASLVLGLIRGGTSTRIPDGLDEANKVIQEVKNVNYQALTGQLKAFIEYAKQGGYKFELFVRESTQLSKPLQNALNGIQATVKRTLPDKK